LKTDKPLLNKKYLLEKFPGKGGWTYAAIPEILQDKHSHFGCVDWIYSAKPDDKKVEGMAETLNRLISG